MTPSKRWSSRFILVFILGASMTGCGSGVLLTREGIDGGVARYLYKEHQGPMVSPHRGEAFTQIKRYCVGSYKIIKEGPTRGRKRIAQGIGKSDVIEEQWWGIRFRCGQEEDQR